MHQNILHAFEPKYLPTCETTTSRGTTVAILVPRWWNVASFNLVKRITLIDKIYFRESHTNSLSNFFLFAI